MALSARTLGKHGLAWCVFVGAWRAWPWGKKPEEVSSLAEEMPPFTPDVPDESTITSFPTAGASVNIFADVPDHIPTSSPAPETVTVYQQIEATTCRPSFQDEATPIPNVSDPTRHFYVSKPVITPGMVLFSGEHFWPFVYSLPWIAILTALWSQAAIFGRARNYQARKTTLIASIIMVLAIIAVRLFLVVATTEPIAEPTYAVLCALIPWTAGMVSERVAERSIRDAGFLTRHQQDQARAAAQARDAELDAKEARLQSWAALIARQKASIEDEVKCLAEYRREIEIDLEAAKADREAASAERVELAAEREELAIWVVEEDVSEWRDRAVSAEADLSVEKAKHAATESLLKNARASEEQSEAELKEMRKAWEEAMQRVMELERRENLRRANGGDDIRPSGSDHHGDDEDRGDDQGASGPASGSGSSSTTSSSSTVPTSGADSSAGSSSASGAGLPKSNLNPGQSDQTRRVHFTDDTPASPIPAADASGSVVVAATVETPVSDATPSVEAQKREEEAVAAARIRALEVENALLKAEALREAVDGKDKQGEELKAQLEETKRVADELRAELDKERKIVMERSDRGQKERKRIFAEFEKAKLEKEGAEFELAKAKAEKKRAEEEALKFKKEAEKKEVERQEAEKKRREAEKRKRQDVQAGERALEEKVRQLEQAKEDLERKLKESTADDDRLRTSCADATSQQTELETIKSTLGQEAQKASQALEAQVQQLEQAKANLENQLKDSAADIERLRTANVEATRHQAVLEKAQSVLQRNNTVLDQRNTALRTDKQKLSNELASLKKRSKPPPSPTIAGPSTPKPPPPPPQPEPLPPHLRPHGCTAPKDMTLEQARTTRRGIVRRLAELEAEYEVSVDVERLAVLERTIKVARNTLAPVAARVVELGGGIDDGDDDEEMEVVQEVHGKGKGKERAV